MSLFNDEEVECLRLVRGCWREGELEDLAEEFVVAVRPDSGGVELAVLNLPAPAQQHDGLFHPIDVRLRLLAFGGGDAAHQRGSGQQLVEDEQKTDQERN